MLNNFYDDTDFWLFALEFDPIWDELLLFWVIYILN